MTRQERVLEEPLDPSSSEFQELESLVLRIGAKLTRRYTQKRLLNGYSGTPQEILRYLVLNNHVSPQQIIVDLKRCDKRLMHQLVRQWNAAERDFG